MGVRISLIAMGVLAGCGPAMEPPRIVTEDATDLPLVGLDPHWHDTFFEGDALFDAPFRTTDGVGPYYVRQACSSCHQKGGRGPGFVQKMAQVAPDGVTPMPGQPMLPWGHTIRPLFTAGARAGLLAPQSSEVKVTQRSGVPLLGHGYLEAIDDAEILRVEAEQAQRTDGISGRVNRVTFTSEHNAQSVFTAPQKGDANLIGRFGLKARIATLDDFTADAFQGDMGITSPMRPHELPNPEGLTDDAKPGVDVDLATVNAVADYIRMLQIPKRTLPAGNGEALFTTVGCAVCHVSTLRTRTDYPLAPLAGVTAPVFTDLLLHDMGPAFADGLEDGSAHSSEWRTAPLIGLRFVNSFLHDSRAPSVEAAIVLHGGDGSEAKGSVEAFQHLSSADRAALLEYVNAL